MQPIPPAEPKPEPLVEIIAGALTRAEREFSIAAGAGTVMPGQYLDNRAKARAVLAELEDLGYAVTQSS